MGDCCSNVCKCRAMMKVAAGVFVLLAAFMNWTASSWWWYVVGLVMILFGVVKLVPFCCCKTCAKPAEKKRKK